MSEYVSDVLGEENYFVCCRCSKKHDAEKHGMTLDDVLFEWDYDTDEEYLEVFKEGEFQIHRDCSIWEVSDNE